jgi:O-acetylserine/cysteine efflux transporter
MPLTHVALALLTVAVWGSNFVVIRWGLNEFPPLLLSALRFSLAAIPLVLWFRLPRSHWRAVLVYGLLQFVLQFASMYSAIALGMPPGLTSLVVQVQALFTVLLAAALLKETVNRMQWSGLCIAFTGIAWAAFNVLGQQASSVPWAAFALTLLGALGWGAGNVQLRRMAIVLGLAPLPTLTLMAWASLMAAPPLFLMSLWLEGADSIGHAINNASMAGWGAVLFQSYANTLLGYGIWSWLISQHGAVKVAPYSLLVPVFGVSSTAWFLGEALTPWKWGVIALVMSGLLINQRGAMLKTNR